MQEKNIKMLLTPSNTPEFSPIENMFGYVKRKLQDLEFKSKEQAAKLIAEQMFGLKKSIIGGFYKKSLSNMYNFWLSLNR